jgi:SsrA-binding protein
MLISNKKGYFDYFLSDEVTAGMILTGLQVKAIRAGKASLVGAHCYLGTGHEMFANFSIQGVNVQIKLLLNKKEIEKLRRKCEVKGFTLIPVNMHLSRGMIKMKVALGKGKKQYDKRQVIKERDASRDF